MAIRVWAGTKPGHLHLLGRYVPMTGRQFGQNVSFSLTLRTWEQRVMSEVDRKMILMGHPISYVIYDQLLDHLTIVLNVLLGLSIS